MSEGTMVVTAPPVSFGNSAPTGFGSYNPGGATGVPPSQAQAMLMQQIFAGQTFNSYEGVELVNKNNLNDLLAWIKNCVYLDNCVSSNNSRGLTDMIEHRDSFKNWQLNSMSDQLSGGPYSVVSALANFFWGNGRPMNVDINKIGLELAPQKIAGFNDQLMAMSAPGSYNFSLKFAYDTGIDSLVSNYYLGNVTLQMEGTLNRDASGQWTFNGVVRGYQDKYDFNASTHRTKTNEDMTTIGNFLGQHFQGVDYPININGQINDVSFSGQ